MNLLHDKSTLDKWEDKSPFAVRLFWLAVAVIIIGGIYVIYVERDVRRAERSLAQLQRQTANDNYTRCLTSLDTRIHVTIPNAKGEEILFTYIKKIVHQNLISSKLVVKDKHIGKPLRNAALQRVQGDSKLLAVIPHIVIPPPIKPCGLPPDGYIPPTNPTRPNSPKN